MRRVDRGAFAGAKERLLRMLGLRRNPKLNSILGKVFLRGTDTGERVLSFTRKRKKQSGARDINVWDLRGAKSFLTRTAEQKRWGGREGDEEKYLRRFMWLIEPPLDAINVLHGAGNFADRGLKRKGKKNKKNAEVQIVIIDKEKLDKRMKAEGIAYEVRPNEFSGYRGEFLISALNETEKEIPIDDVGKRVVLTKEEAQREEQRPATKKELYDIKRAVRAGRGTSTYVEDPLLVVPTIENGLEEEVCAPPISWREARDSGGEEVELHELVRQQLVKHRKRTLVKKKAADYLLREYG